MLNTDIVREIRNTARGMDDAALVAYVKDVTQALGCTYGTIWSTIFGRNWTDVRTTPPLADPFPAVKVWGEWYDRVLEHFGVTTRGDQVRKLNAIRALRRA